MSEKKVLLIDDSATIRRLVDSELSAAGYFVMLAPTAEEGIEKAVGERPDLIILDHQLPGTTGYEVCCKLLENPSTAGIPIVASSTLRKKAYSEYVDCDNVVDMLPKPYKPEVLVATVENAMDTAAMIVQSQSDGSAVPEVINELGESALSGSFGCFGLREVIDLVNNGNKTGLLEVSTDEFRVYVFCDRGRIQAVTASGVDPTLLAKKLPEQMAELAPVIKSTVTGKKGTEVDGLVELLNNKVLDPRLLKKLLRLQAAILLKMCFDGNAVSFRFENDQQPPQLFAKLPLDSSLVALLVEGSVNCELDELPPLNSDTSFVRKAIRGQSVDRAGLSSKHIQLMKQLSDPVSVSVAAQKLDWSEQEAYAVLNGFVMADLVEQVADSKKKLVYTISQDFEFKQRLQGLVEANSDEEHQWKSVSDCLSLSLLFRRQRPHAVMVDMTDKELAQKFHQLKEQNPQDFAETRLVAAVDQAMNVPVELFVKLGFDFQVAKSSDLTALMDAALSDQRLEVVNAMTSAGY